MTIPLYVPGNVPIFVPGALDFQDGASAPRVNHGASTLLDVFGADATIGAWVKRKTNGTNQVICSMGDFNTGFYFFVEGGADGKLRLSINNDTTDAQVDGAIGSVPLNHWVYVVGQYDFTAKTIVLWSGVRGAQAAISTPTASSTGLGAYTVATTEFWGGNGDFSFGDTFSIRGAVARIQLWNRRLSDAEIIHSQYHPNEVKQGCVLLTDYNDTGIQVDRSGYNHHGRIVNGVVQAEGLKNASDVFEPMWIHSPAATGSALPIISQLMAA